MKGPRLFSTGKFAKLSRTTRDTLHHYDKIGVLPAALRGENNYRYYSAAQLSIVNMIRVLQALGMSLDEIIDVQGRRTPAFLDKLYTCQIEKIDKKIDGWVRARKLLLTLQEIIHSALNVDEAAITIQFMPAAAIILGNLNDFSRGRDDWNALVDFYHGMRDRYPDLDLNYPVWAVLSEEQVKRGNWHWPDRYYFYNPEGRDKRPAALYAIGYTRGGYGQTDGLYARMADYIGENGFEVCGDTYEEYPLNELSVADHDNYLVRVMMTVREKKSREHA
jgi:DNA-binding transcriptional MerR regulator